MYRYLKDVATSPAIRLGVKLLLLTMLRKSEMAEGEWGEVDFTKRIWTIPAARMKRRNPHNVCLSNQALDILVALTTCAGASRFIFPLRYDGDQPMSKATLNRVTMAIIEVAQADGVPLAPFTPHDFRRTASTVLHEAGYASDWIEKCLAHEQRGVPSCHTSQGGRTWPTRRMRLFVCWQNVQDQRSFSLLMLIVSAAPLRAPCWARVYSSIGDGARCSHS